MAMTGAERIAAMRARAALARKCVTCAKRKARQNLATCKLCNDAAKDRVKRSRAKSP